ncbi:MAG TPA: hypothetical protein VER04_18620 [Polyangiaceae bacterium]|nr:hypothetical protein [Polyangiaceae bacterium]
MKALLPRLKASVRDRDIWPAFIFLWVASALRVALAVPRGERFGFDATLALICLVLLPWLLLPRKSESTASDERR